MTRNPLVKRAENPAVSRIGRISTMWVVSRCLPLLAGLCLGVSGTVQADNQQPSQGNRLGNVAEHKNMDLVGTNDLQARSTYQPAVHHYANGKYILFAGHHALGTNPVTHQQLPSFNPKTGKNEPNGTSIVDVTDPANPVYLFHIPVGTPVTPPALPTNGGAQYDQRICDGSTLPIHDSKVYLLRSYSNSAHEIWDVTNPSSPVGVRTVAGGNPVIGSLAGTHKSWWECDTGIAYIVGRRSNDTANGWKPGNHMFIMDLGNRRAQCSSGTGHSTDSSRAASYRPTSTPYRPSMAPSRPAPARLSPATARTSFLERAPRLTASTSPTALAITA